MGGMARIRCPATTRARRHVGCDGGRQFEQLKWFIPHNIAVSQVSVPHGWIRIPPLRTSYRIVCRRVRVYNGHYVLSATLPPATPPPLPPRSSASLSTTGSQDRKAGRARCTSCIGNYSISWRLSLPDEATSSKQSGRRTFLCVFAMMHPPFDGGRLGVIDAGYRCCRALTGHRRTRRNIGRC